MDPWRFRRIYLCILKLKKIDYRSTVKSNVQIISCDLFDAITTNRDWNKFIPSEAKHLKRLHVKNCETGIVGLAICTRVRIACFSKLNSNYLNSTRRDTHNKTAGGLDYSIKKKPLCDMTDMT